MVPNEEILVVRRSLLFPAGTPETGLHVEHSERYLAAVREHGQFLPRPEMEEDHSYQQVIPYIVYRHGRRFFLFRRLKRSHEKRLHSAYSLGVGGHLNPVDGADPITALQIGLRREWAEEVNYSGAFAPRLLGVIKDERDEVGKVHVGFCFLVEGDTTEISIRETDKLAGALRTRSQIEQRRNRLEGWSQLVWDHLFELGLHG